MPNSKLQEANKLFMTSESKITQNGIFCELFYVNYYYLIFIVKKIIYILICTYIFIFKMTNIKKDI